MSIKAIQKLCAVIVMTGTLFTLAACNRNGSSAGTSGAPASASQAGSSPSGASAPSGTSSGSSSVAPSSKAPTAVKNIEDAAYKVDTVKYQKDPESKDIVVAYPQLSKKGTDYSKVNALLKSTAMQTLNAKGNAVKELKVSDSITFEGSGFLSVVFKETVKLGSADSVRSIRVVNYDLKAGKTVSTADMLNENDALLNTLLALAKDRLGAAKGASLTKESIKTGFDAGQFYFGRTKIGFYLTLESGKEPEELAIRYGETAKFRTANTAWKNFVE